MAVRRHFDPQHSKLFPDLTSSREHFTAWHHCGTGCSGSHTGQDLCTASDELPGYLGRQKGTLIRGRNPSPVSRLRKKDFSIIFIVKAKFLTMAVIKEWSFARFEGLVAPMNLSRRMVVI